MTRLREEWIKNIEETIEDHEIELESKIHMNFIALAANANGISYDQVMDAAKDNLVAVIPITVGEGIIGTFCQSIAAILRKIGFTVLVTVKTDVDGMAEAYEKGATYLFMADDERYIALNIAKNRMSDNNDATARGYVTALSAVDNLERQEVLVLGGGVVGQKIMKELLVRGAIPILYDKNAALMEEVCSDLKINMLKEPSQIINYKYVIDATSEGSWLHKEMLDKEVWISAPGVPLSLDPDALACYGQRLIHDWLQIGTVVMAGELAK